MPAELTIHDSLNKRELTLHDVIAILDAKIRFLAAELTERIDTLENKVDLMFRLFLERQDNMDERLHTIEQRMGKVETRLEDM